MEKKKGSFSKSKKYIETPHSSDHCLGFNFPSHTILETMLKLEFESVVGMNDGRKYVNKIHIVQNNQCGLLIHKEEINFNKSYVEQC